MHRVGSAGNTSNSVRSRKEKRFTYVIRDSDDSAHCAGINCLAMLNSSDNLGHEQLFAGSRDGTLKRWTLDEHSASCSATFESHIDWVNDAILVGDDMLVSCSSDATLKVWDALSQGICTRTLHQHSDYVTCLAGAKQNSNVVASGGLGGEVFIWDLEAALVPITKSNDIIEDDLNCASCSGSSVHPSSLRATSSSNGISVHTPPPPRYVPVAAKGHKQSVYALSMNSSATLLVSGGTEKVVRVWDPRTGSKALKLRGHTDNIRALLLDPTGRLCLSGSSDSMIRLWDLGQQRCLHSYAVHTDSVWALASTSSFDHVYSGGRDRSLHLTDLTTRESVLLCTEEHPIVQLVLEGDNVWVATTDSCLHRWPAEGIDPKGAFRKGVPFLAGSLSFSRARLSLEGSSLIPVYKEPNLTIRGASAIVQHEILNNKRHILTKDAVGSVKLWDITRGVAMEDYGMVPFDEKKEELFEMVSIPTWFTVDTRLGSLSIHLDTQQCFCAELYAADLNIHGKPEDDKVNLARETLKGLLAHWLTKKKQQQQPSTQNSSNGDAPCGKDSCSKTILHPKLDGDANSAIDTTVYPAFEFSTTYPPSIITEGTQGGPWRKKITNLDGTEDEKDFPSWCLDAVLNNRLPPRENTKCSFFLHPSDGSAIQILTQGKLSAPRILKINKVINYVMEKLVLDKPLESIASPDQMFSPPPVGMQSPVSAHADGSPRPAVKTLGKLKSSIEILCNNQVLGPELSLATVRAYIWKKPDDLILNYRVTSGK